MSVVDVFGRTINSLRVSVTDRCNFRCSYCMPMREFAWIPHEEILRYEEMLRLVRIFTSLGIRKIKITGGEPMIRLDLHVFINSLVKESGIRDVSLTTNGYFLDKQAQPLSEAGLRRLTVSLDSLREERFNAITRRQIFRRIYDNVMMLRDFPFKPVKVNAVIIRGFNDDEIIDFIRFAQETGYTVRFIEFMPLDGDDNWSGERVVTADEIREIVSREFSVVASDTNSVISPAETYRLADGSAEFGIIGSVSSPFCARCGRIRITADGYLRTCLFSHHETSLKELLRCGMSDAGIAEVIRTALIHKEEGHLINRKNFIKPSRPMHQIGG